MDSKTPTFSPTSGKAGMTKGNFAHSPDDPSVCMYLSFTTGNPFYFLSRNGGDNYDSIPVIIREDQGRHHWRLLEDMDMDSNAR